MSQTYIALLVTLLAPWLPSLGLTIGNEELTTTLMTIISIVAALWGFARRYKGGGVNVFGLRHK